MTFFPRAAASVAALAAIAALATGPTAPAFADSGTFTPDQKQAIEKIVKDYLVANPDVLLEIQNILEAKQEKQAAEKSKAALADNAKDLFRSAGSPVAGNKDGDITVTEFFDYNCGYCKRSFPEMTKLISADPKVRVVFKEFPILSKGSEEAAKVALAAKLQGKYWEVHQGLFEAKGQANEATALKVAEKAGLDMAKLKTDMEGPEVKAELKSSKELAAKMGINGTPHFLVGDKSIPGAPDSLLTQLNSNIADLRKNGCSYC